VTSENREPHEAGPSAGDPVPPRAVLLEVRVAEVGKLFNAIDPSPFREKDLDHEAEAFIVDWARESPRHSSFALLVHLDRTMSAPDDAGVLGKAIRAYFAYRAQSFRRKLKRLFATGRISLAIGLAVLTALLVASELLANLGESRYNSILRESLFIGGWVAEVAAARDLPLRLVADSRGRATLRSVERDACARGADLRA